MPVTSDMGPQSRKSSRTSQVHRKKKKKKRLSKKSRWLKHCHMKKSQDLQGFHQLQMVCWLQWLLFSIVFISLFSLFPFSTLLSFSPVCCFSHKYPHQCISIPTFHFPTCCSIETPLHTNLQLANFQSANMHS